jgi:cytochrome P450
LSAWTFALPVSVVASILGFADDELAQVCAWTSDFVACLSPLSSPAQIADAHVAADRLLVRMKALVEASAADSTTLVGTVARQARAVGWDNADAIVANLIGLLSQTCDATAGLIGNTIRALRSQPDSRAELVEQPTRLSAFVDEVSRHDPSVQNTRRFVSEDMTINGVSLHPGDAILVLLAAANRDPAANVDPHAFRIDRPNRRVFSFGHARHQCPGQTLACTIAATAVSQFLRVDVPTLDIPLEWRFHPSANARIPVFIDRAMSRQHR